MNHTITLETDDPKVLETLTWLAKRLGIKIHSDININSQKSKERLLKIINKGGDMSYIKDPVAWQKETRKDR